MKGQSPWGITVRFQLRGIHNMHASIPKKAKRKAMGQADWKKPFRKHTSTSRRKLKINAKRAAFSLKHQSTSALPTGTRWKFKKLSLGMKNAQKLEGARPPLQARRKRNARKSQRKSSRPNAYSGQILSYSPASTRCASQLALSMHLKPKGCWG